jgi:RNA polymerase sigma-70 factor (ECF subfamily)
MDDESTADGTEAHTFPADAIDDEGRLIERLRAGDEAAFMELMERYQEALVRLAMLYVGDRGAAEDTVQETWLGVFRGIERFEGRSSLKTWLFRILTNRAKRRGERDRRMMPFSVAWPDDEAVDPDRFIPQGEQWAGHWSSLPEDWSALPEERFASMETRALIDQVIAGLPANQRQVVMLRDIEGWDSQEVCNALGLSETNQRVLLHRARSKVRRVLEENLAR